MLGFWSQMWNLWVRKLHRNQTSYPGVLNRLREERCTVNVGKTQAITVGGYKQPPPLRLQEVDVAWSLQAKYLGVTINSRLTMAPHVRTIIAKCRSARFPLHAVPKSRLPLRAKLGVYKAYIRPLLTYAAPAWYALTSATNRKILSAQQNITLRKIVAAPRYVRDTTIQRDLGIESLEDFCRDSLTLEEHCRRLSCAIARRMKRVHRNTRTSMQADENWVHSEIEVTIQSKFRYSCCNLRCWGFGTECGICGFANCSGTKRYIRVSSTVYVKNNRRTNA